jgi:aryl-alcohol dehydrogenase-like predicted oxidoreductase
MRYREFGRTGWEVSEIGYGMWGLGAWSGSEDSESLGSLQRAIDLGCNFFDTAWVYGNGHSEKLLGQVLRVNSGKKIFVATKVPPKNRSWPAPAHSTLDENYPPEHITEYVDKSLRNLGLQSLDLIQLHTWNDSWLADARIGPAIEKLKTTGKLRAVGISLNRWQPWNGLKAVRAGLVDAVQVVYNIFDQNPEDELFPACSEKNVAVIARVPFDEGSLTGTLTASSKWAEGDWRNSYFSGGKLQQTLERVDALKPLLRETSHGTIAKNKGPHDAPAFVRMTLPELALRFILSNPDVSTTIPEMRKTRNVEANLAVSERGALSEHTPAYLSSDLLAELRRHRWERKLTPETLAGKGK